MLSRCLDRTVCVCVTCLGSGVYLDRVMVGFQLVLLCLLFTDLKLNDRWRLSGRSVKGLFSLMFRVGTIISSLRAPVKGQGRKWVGEEYECRAVPFSNVLRCLFQREY